MPCFSESNGPGTHTVYVEKGVFSSRLCGVFSVLEKQGLLDTVLNQIDWKEAGTSKEGTVSWWERHKKEDAHRRKIEEEERAQKRARARVLSKLSPQEKRLLGINK